MLYRSYGLYILYISKMYKTLIYIYTHEHIFFPREIVVKYLSAHPLPQDSYLLLVITSLSRS